MGKETPYGESLIEIANGLWEHNCRVSDGIAEPYKYTDEQFRACLKIFMEPLLWKMWGKTGGWAIGKRSERALELGEALRSIILEFTGIDSHKLYDNYRHNQQLNADRQEQPAG